MADRIENLTLESAIKIQEDYSPAPAPDPAGRAHHPGPRRLAEDPLRPPRIPDHHRLQPGRPVRPRALPGQAGLPAADLARRRSRAPATCRSRRDGTTRS
ncbi:MAG: hypothetical protein MZU79_06435 [Anaerotruncus sp.]|nr:hypothetical protein [Anaerotruncus sp.]